MQDLRDVLRQVLDGGLEPSRKASPEEMRLRAVAIGRLFRAFGETEIVKAEMYVDETLAIPLDKLQTAVTAVIRANVWHRLPVLGELWRAARVVSGMDREQYRNGVYVPAPREWPPEGKRYGICTGTFEDLGAGPLRIAAPADAPRLDAGEEI